MKIVKIIISVYLISIIITGLYLYGTKISIENKSHSWLKNEHEILTVRSSWIKISQGYQSAESKIIRDGISKPSYLYRMDSLSKENDFIIDSLKNIEFRLTNAQNDRERNLENKKSKYNSVARFFNTLTLGLIRFGYTDT